MSRRSLPTLLVLLAVLAVGVAWLVRAVVVEPGPAAGSVAASPATERAEADSPAPTPELAATATEAPDSPEIEPTSPTIARETVDAGDDAAIDMTESWSVEGRVLLPPGTPPDEHAEVVASGGEPFAVASDGKRKTRAHSRSPVAPDGTFRASFSKATVKGRLALESRYLYLPDPFEIAAADAPALSGTIVLKPELGGCIRGRVLLPRNALDRRESLADTEVRCSGISPSDERNWSAQFRGQAKLDENLQFELGGLSPTRRYTLRIDPKELADASLEHLRVAPGRVLAVDLQLQLGARVAGKVVDENGNPVEGVDLMTRIERGMNSTGRGAEDPSAADGSFSIAGIRLGKVTLTPMKAGFLRSEHEIGLLADGDVREGLVIALQRGLSISGRVRWPDGRAASGARIEYRFSHEQGKGRFRYSSNESADVEAAEDGTFSISGLGSTPVALTAQAKTDEDSADSSSLQPAAAGAASNPAKTGPAAAVAPAPAKADPVATAAAASAKSNVRRWTAHVENVAPGTSDLVITLEPGATIKGRAVDDLGAPVADFRVRAELADGAQPWERRQGSTHSRGKDGEFTIVGLHQGNWNLIADAKGYAESSERRVTLPGDEAPLELVLPRAARITGSVVDTGGRAVARASVRAVPSDEGNRFMYWNEKESKATSDSEGRFELVGVAPGPVKVAASHDGMAASASLAFDLPPGGEVGDVVLALRRPGRIEGEVVDDAGRPAPGRNIWLNGSDGRSNRNVKADASGRFEIDGLAPDRYWLSSQPSEEEMAEIQGDESESRAAWAKLQKSASVTLEEGETEHVVLGGTPKDGVRVRGTIYAGSAKDRTVPGCSLWVYRRSGGERSPISGASDAQGRYEVVVDGAGEYSFTVGSEKRGTSTTMAVTVPEKQESLEHDLVLPGGRIAGRVIGIDGKAAAQVQVMCQPESMTAMLSGGASYGQAQTDDAGAFVFDGLQAGTYRFEAGAMSWQNVPASVGKCVRGGVVLEEGGALENLELRLRPLCRVEGLVVGPDGEPVAGAMVFARDEQGNMVAIWPMTKTDPSGRFEMDGITPGKATFTARAKNLVSPETAPVAIREGETGRVEMKLRAGTRLRVVVREGDERAVGAMVTIADDRGQDLTQMYGSYDGEFYGQGGPDEGRVLGPLPPGRYTVTATNHDRTSASTEVSVSGQEEEVVTLRFGG